jgi:hypothetical protein
VTICDGTWTQLRSQGVTVLFIEVQNNSPEFLREQSRVAAHTMPDYQAMSENEAVSQPPRITTQPPPRSHHLPLLSYQELDYLRRVAQYVGKFESLSMAHPVETKWSFMICDHTARSYEMHNVRGNVPLQVVNFVMNMRTGSHKFYLSR